MSFTPGKLSRSGRAETRSRTKDDVRRVMQAVDKVPKKFCQKNQWIQKLKEIKILPKNFVKLIHFTFRVIYNFLALFFFFLKINFVSLCFYLIFVAFSRNYYTVIFFPGPKMGKKLGDHSGYNHENFKMGTFDSL